MSEESHKIKKQKINIAKQKIKSSKKVDKGLIMVMTGAAKGKTTAAMGLILRALAYEKKNKIFQFIKGSRNTGEIKMLSKISNCEIVRVGEGFTWETQDKQKDIELAQLVWQKAKVAIVEGLADFILLDEINIVLRYDYIDVLDVISTLKRKPKMMTVILTGRNAKQEIIDIADCVTEMTLGKHHYRAGVKAQEGIEY